jgi:hypothetical protein
VITGVGKGVSVAVGGNQTMVGVGVEVGGSGVSLGSGGSGVGAGRQALMDKKTSIHSEEYARRDGLLGRV